LDERQTNLRSQFDNPSNTVRLEQRRKSSDVNCDSWYAVQTSSYSTVLTETDERRNPTVRVEYDEAFAIGGIGESLQATKNKSWGDGPYIHPLKPDDPVDPMYILYVFKPNSLYNRRFEQRRRMKELLGRHYRKLVERAKYHRHTKKMFLESLSADEAHAIQRILDVDPGEFWRAARGKSFISLPPRQVQLLFDFDDEQREQ
jgi:hypothetical protein